MASSCCLPSPSWEYIPCEKRCLLCEGHIFTHHHRSLFPQDTPRNASSPDLKKQQEKKKKQKEKAPTRDIFHLRFPLLGIFGNLKHTV